MQAAYDGDPAARSADEVLLCYPDILAVTLGAKRFETDEAGNLQKEYARHPIVEDHVVIYAGATILARLMIGKGSVTGANVWLIHSVSAYSQIMQTTLKLSI